MKIAFIGQKGVPAIWGGVEKHVDHLSQKLTKFGYEVIIYTRPYYVSKAYVGQYNKKQTGIQLISLPSIHTKHLDAISHTFISTLHAIKENVDVYHYQGVGPSLLSWIPRLFRPRATVITTFHSPDRLHQKWGVIARSMLTLGELTALLFSHKTIVVSKDLQQYCLNRYKKNTVYIPNGVPQAENKLASLITAQYNLNKNEYFLVVSRLVRHKGIHHLIEAFKKIDTDKKLVIVGDSSYSDNYVSELHEMASDDERIIFTGYQSGKILEELYSNCFCYIQPSESEGLSISLLEAASYGRAVLVSDIPANTEVIANKGFIFRNKDLQDLADKIKELLLNEKKLQRYGKLIRQHVLKEYCWDTIANLTSELYESVEDPMKVKSRVQEAVK